MKSEVTAKQTDDLADDAYPLTLKKGGKSQSRTFYRALRRSLDNGEKALALQCKLGFQAARNKAVLEALIESDTGLTYRKISDILKSVNVLSDGSEERERINRSNRRQNYDSKVAVSAINAGFRGIVFVEAHQSLGVYSTSRLEGGRPSAKDLNNDIYRLCVLQKIK